MFAAPFLNLVVIRSADIERARFFYEVLGLSFEKQSHGNGPDHYSYEANGLVFEIYPLKEDQTPTSPTSPTRLGFSIDDVDATMDDLREMNIEIISLPQESEWGRRAVVKDLDGHIVELTTHIEAR